MTLRSAALASVGAAAIVGVWSAVAASQLTVVVPSPAETMAELSELAQGPLWIELGRTSWRAARGVAAAVTIGVVLGLLTGSSATLSSVLAPTRAILTGMPPIIAVVLVSLWVGIDGDAVPTVIGVATLPIIWIATAEAVRSIDAELVEMAAGLQVGRVWTLRHLTVPAIAPPVRAVVAYVCATALRLTIMAELLTSPDGIGARIARARTALDTTQVFAWALVAIVAAVVLEAVTLRYRADGAGRRDPDADWSATPGR